MAGSRASVLELALEQVQELQLAGSRTTVLELVLELVIEVEEMASSRTSDLEFNN